MREAEAHLRRSAEALRSAELSLGADLRLDAVSRAYYAMFHAAHALLAGKGVHVQTHKGLIHRTRELWGDELGPELMQALAQLQSLREESDYDVGVNITGEEAEEACETGRRFVAAAERLLGGASSS